MDLGEVLVVIGEGLLGGGGVVGAAGGDVLEHVQGGHGHGGAELELDFVGKEVGVEDVEFALGEQGAGGVELLQAIIGEGHGGGFLGGDFFDEGGVAAAGLEVGDFKRGIPAPHLPVVFEDGIVGHEKGVEAGVGVGEVAGVGEGEWADGEQFGDNLGGRLEGGDNGGGGFFAVAVSRPAQPDVFGVGG